MGLAVGPKVNLQRDDSRLNMPIFVVPDPDLKHPAGSSSLPEAERVANRRQVPWP